MTYDIGIPCPGLESVNSGGVKAVDGIPTPFYLTGSQTAISILANDSKKKSIDSLPHQKDHRLSTFLAMLTHLCNPVIFITLDYLLFN